MLFHPFLCPDRIVLKSLIIWQLFSSPNWTDLDKIWKGSLPILYDRSVAVGVAPYIFWQVITSAAPYSQVSYFSQSILTIILPNTAKFYWISNYIHISCPEKEAASLYAHHQAQRCFLVFFVILHCLLVFDGVLSVGLETHFRFKARKGNPVQCPIGSKQVLLIELSREGGRGRGVRGGAVHVLLLISVPSPITLHYQV